MKRAHASFLCALWLAASGCDAAGSARGRAIDGDASTTERAADAGAEPDTGAEDAGAAADSEAPRDAGARGDADADPSDALFRPDHVLEVRITMAPRDWEQLRQQRFVVGAPRANCAGQMAVEPYTNFRADLSIDGMSLSNVAVRKKGGLGSSSSERPGLKIDVHEYVADQSLFGLEHLTLNNNHQDPSLIHQCLGYGLFRSAGLPASRCNFAHVVVNGEDLGIYSNVETLKKEFLRRNFAAASGELFESGGEFLAGRVADFEPKSSKVPPDCSALDAVATALAASDDSLVPKLGMVLDIPEFLRFWAMEVITDHWDGYTNNQNNFYVYADPSSRQLKFIPWGIDSTFEGRKRTTRPMSVFACGALAWRLYHVPSTRSMYLATLKELLAKVWQEPRILAEIDRMQALVKPYLAGSEADEVAKEIAKLRDFVSTRADTLLRELAASEPVWPYPADQSCRIRVGSLSASFNTTWDTLEKFDVGSGTMSGDLGGVALGSASIHASAGLGDDGKGSIRLLNQLPDGRYATVYLVIQDLADVAPGKRAIDLSEVAAVIAFYDPKTGTSSSPDLIFPGTLTLDRAGTSSGATVSGTVSGDVLEL